MTELDRLPIIRHVGLVVAVDNVVGAVMINTISRRCGHAAVVVVVVVIMVECFAMMMIDVIGRSITVLNLIIRRWVDTHFPWTFTRTTFGATMMLR
jgi:hypothetical protein